MDQGRLKRDKRNQLENWRRGSKSYDIRALWQRSQDLGILSAANSLGGLGHPSKLLPNDHVSLACPLSDVP